MVLFPNEANMGIKFKRWTIEIVIAILLGACAFGVLIWIDGFDRLVSFVTEHENWELDEIILGIWIGLIIGLIFAIRHLLHEISMRKRNEQRLKEAMRKSAELSQMKSNFLAMVSHELRTPLTSIIGFAKLIRKDNENISECGEEDDGNISKMHRRIGENISVIIAEGDRLTGLINNVLDLTKLESGHYHWNVASVSIRDVLAQSMDAMRVILTDKGLVLNAEVASNLPTIKGDFDRLVQVCINLLANAAKFTPEGQITCRAVAERGNIIVSIEDTGIGVSEKDRKVIFDKFKQLGDTLTDKPTGTGLGLPICKEIIEHHNGKIWCQSNPHGGSTFVFTIPVQ